jgi:ABC-type Fe3+ transport system permease subunit
MRRWPLLARLARLRSARGGDRGRPAAAAGALQARRRLQLAGWATLSVSQGVGGLLYAYVLRFSAVALQSVEAGYARIPASLDDTARTLGARAGRLFFGVHAPLLRPRHAGRRAAGFVDVNEMSGRPRSVA